MNIELVVLVGSALLSLALGVLTIVVHFRRFGGPTIRSNREAYPPLDGVAGRVVRAHASLNEALLPFAIVTGAALSLHVTNLVTASAAIGFFAARLAHAACYLAGVTPWRSVAFYAGLSTTLALASQLPIRSMF